MFTYQFHPTAAPLVKFSNGFRTAERLKPKTDFNCGLLFSKTQLQTNTIFQVRVDKKIGVWSGSLEIGVTCVNPNTLTSEKVPKGVTELKGGTWVMATSTILHDGQPLMENYGFDLEKLEEGNTVGLMRTKRGTLVFFIQGISQGVAVPFIPEDVYVVLNLYGRCAKITLVDVSTAEQNTNTVETEVIPEVNLNESLPDNNIAADKLRFHPNCGPLVKFSNNHRTAERRRPLEEFNNCIVLTHRPLRDEELFQVRIDTLIHKWSGSIEIGLIKNNPSSFKSLEFPTTLTAVGNGTVILSGNGILCDGKATNSSHTNLNLDQLLEGDRIGVMRKANGDVIYCVNGESQGVATNLPASGPIWGCCNLYGMASKVSIVDRNEREEYNLRVTTRTHLDFIQSNARNNDNEISSDTELLFHSNCGFHAAVINNGRTAHRPESMNDFNNGVVLTNRFLNPNEIFEIRLDEIISKVLKSIKNDTSRNFVKFQKRYASTNLLIYHLIRWAGSIEIGVTTFSPTSLEYPSTMTNVRTGTWMMTGNGIMVNGQTTIDAYGQSLDRLNVGDRVGVIRKENGNLHFFVNGIDQGRAASNVPSSVYGVIDLYGQAAQATIISHSSKRNNYNMTGDSGRVVKNVTFSIDPSNSRDAAVFRDIKFHHLHGKNAKISSNGLTACRPNYQTEFNAAIVVSSRILKDNELFEVVIEKLVERWSGNIEVGVTTIKPEHLVFPNTMTDHDHPGTIMLSGQSIMKGGSIITNQYPCNLDLLTVGSKVGVIRRGNGTLHFFINGEDMGAATVDVPKNVYAVIDLYGQCAQVSITGVRVISFAPSVVSIDTLSILLSNNTIHRFSSYCGKNAVLKNKNLTASRTNDFEDALVFSAAPLEFDEIFEVRISEVKRKFTGTLKIGVTSLAVTNESTASNIPPSGISEIIEETWYITGTKVYKNKQLVKDNYCANLDRLCVGDRVGVQITRDHMLRFFINGQALGIVTTIIGKKMHVVVDVYGFCESVIITSTVKAGATTSHNTVNSNIVAASVTSIAENAFPEVVSCPSTSTVQRRRPFLFSTTHSLGVELSNGNMTATRISGYQGFIFSNQSLCRRLFEVSIDKVDKNSPWRGSLMVGVLETNPGRIKQLPFNALSFKKYCWLVIENQVFRNGIKTSKVDVNLKNLCENQTVGVMVDNTNSLHVVCEGKDSIIAKNVSPKCRALVVIYGEVKQISIASKLFKDKQKSSNDDTNGSFVIPRSLEPTPKEQCPYLKACKRFLASISIPNVFFVPNVSPVCYCETCFCRCVGVSLQNELVATAGDPKAEYLKPLGWGSFPVMVFGDPNVPSTDGMTCSNDSLTVCHSVRTNWQIAYHGLKVSDVREVLDARRLRPVKIETDEHKNITPDFAELLFSPFVEFTDPSTQRKMRARVAFQIVVKPGSYKTRHAAYSLPQFIPNLKDTNIGEVHWSTREENTTYLTHLLVNIDGY